MAGGDWRRVSYAEALTAARAIAQALIDHGLSAERPLVILSDNDIEHLLVALGAMLAGLDKSDQVTALLKAVVLQVLLATLVAGVTGLISSVSLRRSCVWPASTTGSTAPSVAGFRNFAQCQLAASGPVSASPSPTTAKTRRSGLSSAAP